MNGDVWCGQFDQHLWFWGPDRDVVLPGIRMYGGGTGVLYPSVPNHV